MKHTSLGKGTRTSKAFLCPVCQKDHGCQVFDIGVIYCLRADQTYDTANLGYLGSLKDGMGGIFADDRFRSTVENAASSLRSQRGKATCAEVAEQTGLPSSWVWKVLQASSSGYSLSDADRAYFAAERERKTQERERQQAQILSITARARQYETVTSHLPLIDEHRQLLRDRGLSDADIDRIGFKSWIPGIRVPGVTKFLPGIHPKGDRLMGKGGIFIPAKDAQGNIMGAQIKPNSGSRKYIWLSSVIKDDQGNNIGGNGPQLPGDAMPLFVCRPDTIQSNAIGLCEGSIKAWVSSTKLGQVMIGASTAHYDADLLKQYLSELSAELRSKQVILYPDAGAINNVGNIPFGNHKAIKMCQAWGYEVKVAWWGQERKGATSNSTLVVHCDIDDLLTQHSGHEIDFMTADDFFALHPLRIQKKLEPHLTNLAEGLKTSDFPVPHPHPVKAGSALTVEYQKGERLQVWQSLVESGVRVILDRSGMGSGKSYDSGSVTPAMLGAKQVIYVSGNHRNPTTETLKSWDDLQGRHGGLNANDVNGEIQFFRAGGDKDPDIAPNCERHRLAEILPTRNVPSTGEHICVGCQHLDDCRAGVGSYTYLGDRKQTMRQKRFRAHIESLDADSLKKGTVLIVDEASTLPFTRSFSVKAVDIERTMIDLLEQHPTIAQPLYPILGALRALLIGATGLFGLDHDKILDALPELPDLTIEAIEMASHQGLEFLTTAPDGETRLEDLSWSLRQRFLGDTEKLTEQAEKNISIRWLPEFWQACKNQGRLRITNDGLQITIRNERVLNLLKHPNVKALILLDGTQTPEFFNLWLDTEVTAIAQTAQTNGSVTIFQVGDLGLVGSTRGKQQQRRISTLIKGLTERHPGASVIDSKRFAKEGEGYWYRDSRGSNAYTEAKVIILVGPPIPNIGAATDVYSVMTGRQPKTEMVPRSYTVNASNVSEGGPWWIRTLKEASDPQLAAFIRSWTLAETDQAVGRLRADLRPNEELIIYFLSDYPLDREVCFVRSVDLVPESGTRKEMIREKVYSAYEALWAANEKPTQQAIANLAGVSQGFVSKLFSERPPSQVNIIPDDLNRKINSNNVHQTLSEADPNDPLAIGNPVKLLGSSEDWFVVGIEGSGRWIYSEQELKWQPLNLLRPAIAVAPDSS